MGGAVKGREDHKHVGQAEQTAAAWADVRHLYSPKIQAIVDRIAERGGVSYLDLMCMCVADYHAMAEQIADLALEEKTSSAIATLTAARIQSQKLAKSLVLAINPQSTPNTKLHAQPASVAERRARRKAPDRTDTGDELVN